MRLPHARLRALAVALAALAALPAAGCGSSGTSATAGSHDGSGGVVVTTSAPTGGSTEVQQQTAGRFTVVRIAGGAAVHRVQDGPIVGRVKGSTPLGSQTWLWAVRTSS